MRRITRALWELRSIHSCRNRSISDDEKQPAKHIPTTKMSVCMSVKVDPPRQSFLSLLFVLPTDWRRCLAAGPVAQIGYKTLLFFVVVIMIIAHWESGDPPRAIGLRSLSGVGGGYGWGGGARHSTNNGYFWSAIGTLCSPNHRTGPANRVKAIMITIIIIIGEMAMWSGVRWRPRPI